MLPPDNGCLTDLLVHAKTEDGHRDNAVAGILGFFNVTQESSKRSIYRTAALLWAAALFIGSLQPYRPAHIHRGAIHHLLHVFAFGILTFLLIAAHNKLDRISLWPAAAVFLFGFTIELLQHWSYRNPLEWNDVRDDAIGICAVTALYLILQRLSGPPASNWQQG